MKQKIYWTLLIIAIGVGAFFLGKLNGANLVRSGLVANYPNFKALVTNAVYEKDSTLVLELQAEDSTLASLFNVKGLTNTIEIPYHAAYGIDLHSKFYKIGREGDDLEVLLPAAYKRSFSVYFDRVSLNGKNILDSYGRDSYNKSKDLIRDKVSPLLNKDKYAKKLAQDIISERVMWLFVPYKFNVKIYFGNQQYQLPEIVGLTKDVDEFLKDKFQQEKELTGNK